MRVGGSESDETNLWPPFSCLWSYKLECTCVLCLYTSRSWYQITVGFIDYDDIGHFNNALLYTYAPQST